MDLDELLKSVPEFPETVPLDPFQSSTVEPNQQTAGREGFHFQGPTYPLLSPNHPDTVIPSTTAPVPSFPSISSPPEPSPSLPFQFPCQTVGPDSLGFPGGTLPFTQGDITALLRRIAEGLEGQSTRKPPEHVLEPTRAIPGPIQYQWDRSQPSSRQLPDRPRVRINGQDED